jgi:death on curing protein
MKHVIPLSAETVIHYHEKLTGIRNGVRNPEAVDSAVSAAFSTFDGLYLNDDVYEMAAAIFYNLVKNHPFVDGNKRTASFVAIHFLNVNGKEVAINESDLAGTSVSIAEGDLSRSGLARILRGRG